MKITSSFKDNLTQLPNIENLAEIILTDTSNTAMGRIENKQGQTGSLAVYNYLAKKFSRITPAAAQLGLEIYAEHTIDAKLNPGKHPNIDRLFAVIGDDLNLTISIINK